MKKRCHEAKEHSINTQSEEIEANTGVNSKTVHQEIKGVIGEKVTAKTGCIRSKGGDILIGKGGHPQQVVRIHHRAVPWWKRLLPIPNNDEGPRTLEENLQKALKKRKKRQSRGTRQNTIEMLTALGKFGIKEITKLLNIIHDSGEIPTDLKNKNRYNWIRSASHNMSYEPPFKSLATSADE